MLFVKIESIKSRSERLYYSKQRVEISSSNAEVLILWK